MQVTQTKNEKFDVIGLSVRTSNAQEFSGQGQISGLWEKYFSEQIALKIPNKLEDNLYGVYHDYESDANGAYTLTIGLKVKPGTKAPEGLTLVHVPAQSYSKFTSDKGVMPGIVIEGWKHIWDQKDLNRSYTADFELYDERCSDPQNAQIDIFISIK